MASLVLESKLFSNMFGTLAMRAIFSDETLVQRYLDVESALARVQARLGIIPEQASKEIESRCNVVNVDFERLRARTEVVGYPILPLVEQLTEWCQGNAGQYCHWGATTQDIMDTADVLQIRDALALVRAELEAVGSALASLAQKHKRTPMAGRSHLQHALPITFGYKCAVWLSSMDRHLKRLDELSRRVLVVEFSGAAGTLASLGKEGLRVQEALARELRLSPPDITWHTARDNLAEASALLALISATLGKIGYDVMLMMQSEVGEVYEPFVLGRGASSTMPQKRNPIGAGSRASYRTMACGMARPAGGLRGNGRRAPSRSRDAGGAGGARRCHAPQPELKRRPHCRRSGDDGAGAASWPHPRSRRGLRMLPRFA
jgi:3-carboxy-cis,cis-muconate cycloisomerase